MSLSLRGITPRISSLVGSSTSLSRYRSIAARIESLVPKLPPLSDEELRKQSLSLKYEALSGTPLNELLPQAFAMVCEASRRSIGMQHYRVQLIGGIAMHFHNIVVMQTGEGKTLTATLPMYLAALENKGAHLATANDYLAQRDAELMRPVYEQLGMSVGTVLSSSTRNQRREAYECDITYSTAKEIGFDFLRDRLFKRQADSCGQSVIASMAEGQNTKQSDVVQRGLNFMLVDEADSILIDEARTPLIVSSLPDEVALTTVALYQWSVSIVDQFTEQTDFESDPKSKRVTLSPAGRRLVRSIRKPDSLSRTPMSDIYDQVEQALFVDRNYVLDRHYVVRDGEVCIVDEFTGRLAEGRKWRSGLHQTIEAREGVEVSVETGESARITIQDLFLKYNRLSGMTGTVANSANELKKIYRCRVVDVPTNRPPQRKQWADMVFGSSPQKWLAIATEVATLNQQGRPVLIGTRSIDKSELLSELLTREGIEHQILNARHLSKEASIVEFAGHVGRVTVATNMAGRGTDIQISEAARQQGGLHVIVSELHESARIDRQLIGRCGRQGDPGSFRRFLALDDEILDLGLGEGTSKKLSAHANESPRKLARFAPMFFQAQQRIEQRHFKSRKLLLFHDSQRQEMQIEMGQDPYLDTAGA